MRSNHLPVSLLCLLLGFAACSDPQEGAARQLRIGFVTNSTADFWTIAVTGARKAEEEFDVRVKIAQPTSKGSLVEQKNFLEDMVSAGFDGIAISPLDPENQTPLLDEIAAKTILITHDSDAPGSARRCFIGVDNYVAGRMCGELVRLALPDGGKIMMFVASLDGDNARRRWRGVIDAVFGQSPDSTRPDPSGYPLVSPDGRYTILGCRTDGFDRSVAKDNAADALTRHADLGCMVGLFAHNPPLILEALERAGRLKAVQIVGFDEDGATLRGVREGTVFGTVVQDPYQYGYLSVKVLAALIRGDASVIPPGGILEVPARKITKATVDGFEAELNARLGR